MTTARKSGSALLIVLGFLSFMVVSAVAFAIYMRAERLPSSALRRTVATRHLVHAALAEAISRVDDAVRGDPFPGMCNTNNASGYSNNGLPMDYWEGRVFMPPDPMGSTERHAPITETVSTLTLEGLGYLPPALVNDARFLSRASWSAQWQQLPFDAGRFAYCAVNVSDYFDINRIYGNRGRTAEAGGRISFGYLFDDTFDPTANPDQGGNVGDTVNMSGATAFDSFVHTSRPSSSGDQNVSQEVSGNSTPYVSMLDYNLAMGQNAPSSLDPLFYDWIRGQVNNSPYYEEGTTAKRAARQPFITESASTNETWTADFSTAEGQPFYGLDMSQKSQPLDLRDIYGKLKGNGFIALGQNANILDPLDKWSLWDYLDHDDIPLSLSMPCTERVPMIVALESQVKFQPGTITAGQAEQSDPDPSTKVTKTPYKFKPSEWFPNGGGDLKAVVAFPFKHGSERTAHRFKAQAYVRVFLAPAPADDTQKKYANFRPGIAGSLRPKDQTAWNPSQGNAFPDNVFSIDIGTEEVTLDVPTDVQDESEANCEESITLSLNIVDVLPLTQTIATKKETQKINSETKESIGEPVTTWLLNTRPYTDLNGTVPEANKEYTQAELDALGKFVPYVAVWVRIVDVNENNKTVDLVPAYYLDDSLNGFDPEDNLRDDLNDTFGAAGGNAPMMRFVGEGELSFGTIPALSFGAASTTWFPKSMYAVDPRFNAAPESWFGVDDGNVSFSKWLNKTHAAVNMTDETEVQNGLSEDIFLFTSNQGILQSLGEFAFLPNLSNVGNVNYNGELRQDASSILFRECAWRNFAITRKWYDAWHAAGVGCSVESECLVNPYTDNVAIMMGALANTPLDYWAAARSMSSDCALRKDGANMVNKTDKWYDTADASLRVAFCSRSQDSGDKLACSDVVRFANKIMDEMRAKTISKLQGYSGDTASIWEDVWDDLSWNMWQNNDSETKFLGIDRDLEQNVALHSVDRKFLYSYWRDCFANRQQLFLFFVRAESNALGGPGEGTPAQQGGRAVALVWRDPSARTQNGRDGRTDDQENTYREDGKRRSHATRILFYHQFD